MTYKLLFRGVYTRSLKNLYSCTEPSRTFSSRAKIRSYTFWYMSVCCTSSKPSWEECKPMSISSKLSCFSFSLVSKGSTYSSCWESSEDTDPLLMWTSWPSLEWPLAKTLGLFWSFSKLSSLSTIVSRSCTDLSWIVCIIFIKYI